VAVRLLGLVGPVPPDPLTHTEEGTEPVQNSGQLLILAVFAAFGVGVLSRGRRQQRETQLTQSRVRVGTEVMMTSGLYGTVVDVADDGTIRVETSPGIVSRWDRRAVARIISSPDDTAESAEPAETAPAAEAGVPMPVEPVERVEPAEPALPVEPARPNRDAAPPDRA
jgi:preprotein translocase subunit YajC